MQKKKSREFCPSPHFHYSPDELCHYREGYPPEFQRFMQGLCATLQRVPVCSTIPLPKQREGSAHTSDKLPSRDLCEYRARSKFGTLLSSHGEHRTTSTSSIPPTSGPSLCLVGARGGQGQAPRGGPARQVRPLPPPTDGKCNCLILSLRCLQLSEPLSPHLKDCKCDCSIKSTCRLPAYASLGGYKLCIGDVTVM
jgi:hypothetical protein